MSTILYADRMESFITIPVTWIKPRAGECPGKNIANVSDQICVRQTIQYLLDTRGPFQ